MRIEIDQRFAPTNDSVIAGGAFSSEAMGRGQGMGWQAPESLKVNFQSTCV